MCSLFMVFVLGVAAAVSIVPNKKKTAIYHWIVKCKCNKALTF